MWKASSQQLKKKLQTNCHSIGANQCPFPGKVPGHPRIISGNSGPISDDHDDGSNVTCSEGVSDIPSKTALRQHLYPHSPLCLFIALIIT